jgi:retron-type reverse transcriptase
MKVYRDIFTRIIDPETLFSAWDAFNSNKRNKRDVARFEWHLEENIFALHRALRDKTYRHGRYEGFYVHDPKQRHIHKAPVRDRVLHHAIFSVINPIFEETFIPRSFSCRIGYGTHRGVDMLERVARRISRNGTADCFVLKCDVRKFFDSVDHDTLLSILARRIKDDDAMWLLRQIIGSFSSPHAHLFERKGLPIGNLTSQLFANVYLNEFDQFVKGVLRVGEYFRYTDDFAIVATDRAYLEWLIGPIADFLAGPLRLALHPKKVSIHRLHQGVDFLGYVIFPKHRVIRTKTRRRMIAKLARRGTECRAGEISELTLERSLQSYLGVLSHANAHHLSESLKNGLWFN